MTDNKIRVTYLFKNGMYIGWKTQNMQTFAKPISSALTKDYVLSHLLYSIDSYAFIDLDEFVTKEEVKQVQNPYEQRLQDRTETLQSSR